MVHALLYGLSCKHLLPYHASVELLTSEHLAATWMLLLLLPLHAAVMKCAGAMRAAVHY
jgi:hypothetical protein